MNKSFTSGIWMLAVMLTLLPFAEAGLSAASDTNLPSSSLAAGDDFVSFRVPGLEKEMKLLVDLFKLHKSPRIDCTLWDPWLPMSTVWPAIDADGTAGTMRAYYRDSLISRRLDAEGYVSMQQHRGMAHSEGWPFPSWQQAGGAGWFFSTADEVYGLQYFGLKALTSAQDWEICGAEVVGIDPVKGLRLRATNAAIEITSPAFACGTIVAPFVRLEWAANGLSKESQPYISWRMQGETNWSSARRATFPALAGADGLQYANVPLYKQAGYAGIVTRYRVVIDHAAGSEIFLKSLITAIDTRHPGNNAHYTLACSDYFNWTGDTNFLRAVLPKLRLAMRFAIHEFGLSQEKCVRVPWVGHDGRSGLGRDAAGKRIINLGLGVGNNYYDLVPFGGRDAYATIHYYAALLRLASLEEAVARHPEWGVPSGDRTDAPEQLRQIAYALREHAGKLFWQSDAGRFAGWQDLTGKFYDYGFTFLNLEAIYYGLATPEQATAILDWLDGKRPVAGDTSQGLDIYHWRFGPRATTRRNIETYVWAWPQPETIPWGYQVQDGGAVLGFSYFDLMARLKIQGPDAAWARLEEMLAWFADVQKEGGYRKYYAADHKRGTLQGGGPAGGLGMDVEFMESVLVPQVMLYGFLGMEPRPGGFCLAPNLPSAWPELTVTRIQIHSHVLDLTVKRDEVILLPRQTDGSDLCLWLAPGRWEINNSGTKSKADLASVVIRGEGDCAKVRLVAGQSVRLKRTGLQSRLGGGTGQPRKETDL